MKNAFSLVELSIVLVILGLLVGGILAGQSLIHAAELRKTATDIASIKTSLYTFRDKYFGLPGDLNNATKFWGAADGGDGLGTDCYIANNNNATTCNGNGDGQVGTSVSGPESYRLWQHLVNAGLMSGQYTGVPGPSVIVNYIDDVIGTNLPRSPMGTSIGYVISYPWSNYGYTNGVTMTRGNAMVIAGQKNPTTNAIEGPAFSPPDTWNLDTKLDDGKPGTGFFQIYGGYTGCASSAANYTLSTTIIACQAVIGMGN